MRTTFPAFLCSGQIPVQDGLFRMNDSRGFAVSSTPVTCVRFVHFHCRAFCSFGGPPRSRSPPVHTTGSSSRRLDTCSSAFVFPAPTARGKRCLKDQTQEIQKNLKNFENPTNFHVCGRKPVFLEMFGFFCIFLKNHEMGDSNFKVPKRTRCLSRYGSLQVHRPRQPHLLRQPLQRTRKTQGFPTWQSPTSTP